MSLIIQGTPITDTDHDGLDDGWEMAHFKNLLQGPTDDPDRDGSSNMREQITGTDPTAMDVAFKLDLSGWNPARTRLSWPGSPHFNYEIWGGTNVSALSLIATVAGHFPVTEWFPPYGDVKQFFRVRAVAVP